MPITPLETGAVVGGIDTHQDLHWAAVVDHTGHVLGTEAFSTTRSGYRAMLAWLRSKGDVRRVGVESTGSYGAGITRHLALAGIPVLEVTRPDLESRRRQGKDDLIDAVAAAHAALWGQRVQVAKDRDGAVEALRTLRTTRRNAVKARRATLQLLHNTIVAAADEVRDQVRNMTRMQRLRTCASWRPDVIGYRDPATAAKIALKALARRILMLNDEIADLDRLIRAARRGARVGAARAALRRGGIGWRVPRHGGRQPVAPGLGSELRDVVWCEPHTRVVRQDYPSSAEPRRRPPSQFGPAHGGRFAYAHRRAHESLRSSSSWRGTVEEGDHALLETLRGPRGVSYLGQAEPVTVNSRLRRWTSASPRQPGPMGGLKIDLRPTRASPSVRGAAVKAVSPA